MTNTVLITSRSFGSGGYDGLRVLRDAGLEPVFRTPTHDLDELGSALADAVAWIAGTGRVTGDHLHAAPSLRLIARYGVGFDAVDLDAAREHGVTVTNTPGANSDSVADLAVAMTLSGLRGTQRGDLAVRDGDWSAVRGREIRGENVGVVGFGRIGRGYAERIHALGGRILVFDPFLPADVELPPFARRVTDIADIAACAAVSLHSPGGECLIDDHWLEQARDIVLVNTARADLVDEDAVARGLRTGSLFAYCADTLGVETGTNGSPLLADDLRHAVTITPHAGAQTVQAIDRMTQMSTEDVVTFLRGDEPRNVVLGTRKEAK